MKFSEPTPFIQDLIFLMEGTKKAPEVHYGGNRIDYIGYQLSTHNFQLKILASGMTMRGVKLSNIKAYYGFKSRSAKDMLNEMEILKTAYSELLSNL